MKKLSNEKLNPRDIISLNYDSTFHSLDYTDEIEVLLAFAPYVTLAKVGIICDSVEYNFLKTLFIAYLYKEIKAEFKKHTSKNIENLKNPFHIKTNVSFENMTPDDAPLYFVSKKILNRKKQRFVANSVLVKTAFGKQVGLVISDDYFGLILDYGDKVPKANKFWRQKDVKPPMLAYSLWLSADERKDLEEEIINHLSRELPENLFKKHLNDNSELQNTLSHLINLLHLLKIDFND